MDRIRNKNPLAALEEEKMDHDLKVLVDQNQTFKKHKEFTLFIVSLSL